MPDIDPWLPERLRREASLIRSERSLLQAATDALRQLLTVLRTTMSDNRLDTTVLDRRMPQWRSIVATTIMPTIRSTFGNGFRTVIDSAEWSPDPHVTAYLDDVRNRLVNVADEVFDIIQAEIDEGRRNGESITRLAERVDDVLAAADAPRWKNRAKVIARTETISAYNSGQLAGAADAARALGVPMVDVQKHWLATHDTRTRDSHRHTDGQDRPLTEPFKVGTESGPKSPMLFPGDPSAPAHEVIQCRCTLRFTFPEPLATPAVLSAAGATLVTMADEEPQEHTSVVVVALPAADDPVQGIGPEQKHATLLWFGSTDPDNDAYNPQIAEYQGMVAGAVAQIASEFAPFTETVKAVETLGDEGAHVWMLTGDMLPRVRDEILDYDLELVGVLENVKQFPSFTPHTTVGYTGDDSYGSGTGETVTDEDLAAAAQIPTITYDRLALWWAGEQTEWPLTGQEETMTAAALDQQVRVLNHPLITWATTPSLLAAAVAAIDGPAWHGVLAPEGVATGDRRKFGVDSLRWRELPLPLMWQMETAQGHDGAVLVGRIDTLEREYAEEHALLNSTGVFDTGPYAAEAARLIDGKFMRGVSVDVDDATFHFEDLAGVTLAAEDLAGPGPDVLQVIDDGRVSGATLCTIPAFEEAFVALLDSLSLAASAAPDGSGTSHGWIRFTHPEEAATLVASAGTFGISGWLKQRRVPKGNGEISGRWVDMFAMPVHGGQLNDFAGGSAIAHLNPSTDSDGNDIDGVYQFTPDRQAFHKSFVSRSIEGISRHSEDTDRRPRFVFMGGGPAAGKSSVIRMRAGGPDDLTVDKVIINPDIAKTGLTEEEVEKEGFPPGGAVPGIPEYAERAAAGDPTAAGFAHEESSYMAKQVTQAALDEGMDALLDGTGDSSYAKLQKKILQAKSKGYEIDGIYVTAPTELALVRAKERQVKTGRGVPSSEVALTHSAVSSIVPELARTKIMDKVELWDTTDGGEPILVMEWPDSTIADPEVAFGSGPRILSPDRYETFLAKANQTPGDSLAAAVALMDARIAAPGERDDPAVLQEIRDSLQADLDNWNTKAAAAEHKAVAARLAVLSEEAEAIRTVEPSPTVTAMTDEELTEAVDLARGVAAEDRAPFDLEVLAEYQRRQAAPDSVIEPESQATTVDADGALTEEGAAIYAEDLAGLSDEDLAQEIRDNDQAIADAPEAEVPALIAQQEAAVAEERRRSGGISPDTRKLLDALSDDQVQERLDEARASGDERRVRLYEDELTRRNG